MPRTPLAAAGRPTTVFTGRTSGIRRRQSLVSAHAHGAHPWLQYLRVALAALVFGVVLVIAWTVSDRLQHPSDGVQPAVVSTRVARREVVDNGLSDAATDYSTSDVAATARPSHDAAAHGDDASGVSLYTCAAGALGFSWTLTPRGALRNGDGDACVSYAEGDAAFLLTLVPCASSSVLTFSSVAATGQVRAAVSADSPDLCLDTGDANTQGSPVLLLPCTEVPPGPVRHACRALLGSLP